MCRAAVAALLAVVPPAAGQPADRPPVFEARVYYPAAGKRPALDARFRDHALRLYAKHGIAPVGVFVAGDRLLVLVCYPSVAAREAAWKGLVNDPEWAAVRRASEADGRLVDKVQEYRLDPLPAPAVRAPAAGHRYELVLRCDDKRADPPAGRPIGRWLHTDPPTGRRVTVELVALSPADPPPPAEPCVGRLTLRPTDYSPLR